jgi:ribosome-associated protein
LGEDILLLDIRGLSLFADFFVICNGTSERQLRALVRGVRDSVKKELGILPHHAEGEPVSGWVLLDYVDVIVHVFSPELRAYYDLEGLWHEGKVLLRMQ